MNNWSSLGRTSYRHGLVVVMAAMALSACQYPAQRKLISAGQTIPPGAYMWSQPDGDGPAASALSQNAITERLRARGLNVGTDPDAAPLRTAVALSAQPLAMLAVDSSPKAERLRRPRRNVQCDPHLVRAQLVIAAAATGTPYYRGEASQYACRADVDATAAALTAALLDNLDGPYGTVLVTLRP